MRFCKRLFFDRKTEHFYRQMISQQIVLTTHNSAELYFQKVVIYSCHKTIDYAQRPQTTTTFRVRVHSCSRTPSARIFSSLFHLAFCIETLENEE